MQLTMNRSEKSSSRRDFLRRRLALVPTFSLATCAPLSALRTFPRQAYSPRYFTWEEWAFLHAACARLIPLDEAANAKDPISLIHLVLAGSSMLSTQTAPSAFAMPDFGWRLSDAEVADALNFVRNRWGNHAAAFAKPSLSKRQRGDCANRNVT
jgi:hypothetical protein